MSGPFDAFLADCVADCVGPEQPVPEIERLQRERDDWKHKAGEEQRAKWAAEQDMAYWRDRCEERSK